MIQSARVALRIARPLAGAWGTSKKTNLCICKVAFILSFDGLRTKCHFLRISIFYLYVQSELELAHARLETKVRVENIFDYSVYVQRHGRIAHLVQTYCLVCREVPVCLLLWLSASCNISRRPRHS